MVQAPDQRVKDAPSGVSSNSSSKASSKNTSSVTLKRQTSSVGSLCFDLPNFVTNPPIEAVVFGWGVAEDGQLVRKDLTCPVVQGGHSLLESVSMSASVAGSGYHRQCVVAQSG